MFRRARLFLANINVPIRYVLVKMSMEKGMM
jgi:hypothetical protein